MGLGEWLHSPTAVAATAAAATATAATAAAGSSRLGDQQHVQQQQRQEGQQAPLLVGLCARAAATVGDFTPQHVGNTLWALGQLGE